MNCSSLHHFFTHNSTLFYTIHPFNTSGIGSKGPLLEGSPSTGRKVDVIPSGAVNLLSRKSLDGNGDGLADIEPVMEYLNKETSLESGIFGDYWCQNLVDTLNKTEELDTMVNSVSLLANWRGGSVSNQLKMVAKLMLLNVERKANRDFFYVHMVSPSILHFLLFKCLIFKVKAHKYFITFAISVGRF